MVFYGAIVGDGESMNIVFYVLIEFICQTTRVMLLRLKHVHLVYQNTFT